MARFASPLGHIFLVPLTAILLGLTVHAQITNVTDDTSTPTPGAGHDYIHLLSETVNPANGSLSLRIQLPMAKGRGITVPFYVGYDSNSVSHLSPNAPGQLGWASNNAYLSQGGWQYSAPMASVGTLTRYIGNPQDLTPTYCWVIANFMFTDPSGGQHALNLGSAPAQGPSPMECKEWNEGYSNPSGDPVVAAFLPNSFGGTPAIDPAPSPLYVYTADGTVYFFPGTSLAGTVEDRNGNIVEVTDNGNANFAFTDTAGRVAVSSSGMGPSGTTNTLSVSGLSYGITWKTVSPNFTTPSTQVDNEGVGCQAPPTRSANITTVSQITLPNGRSYQFYYGSDNPHPGYTNPYGLLSEIDYPDGGWVRYTWKLSDTNDEMVAYTGVNGGAPWPNGCVYQYMTPVVATRQVGFGGSSPSLTQAFTYSTTWNTAPNDPAIWTQKSTTVCTTDDVRGSSVCTTPATVPANAFLTVYGYTPIGTYLNNIYATSAKYDPQIPLENTITDYNWGSTTSAAKTVTKTWYNQLELKSQTTVVGGLSSLVTYTYAAFAEPLETDEYDYGAATPSRKTIITYQSFPKTSANQTGFPNSVGLLYDKPCKTIVTDGNNNTVSETDYYYDGGTALCGTVPAPSVTAVSGLVSGTHDETNYGATSSMARGNVTKMVKWLSGGTSPTTTYTYDETGQVLSVKDACGNGTCSDVTGTNHTTMYSYSDSYTVLSGGMNTPYMPTGNTNAYLTKITNPLSQIGNYTYDYHSGQLTTASDENTQPTHYLYSDSLGRLKQISYPDGGQTTLSYNDSPYNSSTPSPSVTTTKAITSSVNEVSTVARDGIGHTVETILSSDPDGTAYTFSVFDGTGKPYQVYNATRCNPPTSCTETTAGFTTYMYDTLGRTTQVGEPDGSTVSTSYSASSCGTATGYSTTVTDEVGNQRSSQTDALGRLTCVWEAPKNSNYNYQTAYTYDTLNNLLSTSQAGGSRTRTFTYDSLSRLLCAANPEVQIVTCPTSGTTFPAGAITYTYDLNANLSSKVAPKPGQTSGTATVTTNYSYDVLNRLTGKSYVNLSTASALYAYDGGSLTCSNVGPPSITNPTNLVGRRSSMCSGLSASSWSYDAMGRPLFEARKNKGTVSETYTVGYTYYEDGSLDTLTYPSGDVVTYTVGAAARVTQVIDAHNNYVSGPEYAAAYAPTGALAGMIQGPTSTFTGMTSTYVYNNRLQLLLNDTLNDSTETWIRYLCYDFHLGTAVSDCGFPAYTTGDSGNVFQIVNELDSTRTAAFTYDPLNRIQQANTTTTTGGNCWGEVYTIDSWGNLTNRAGVPGMTGCATEPLNAAPASSQNHLPGVSYDIAGNVLNDGDGNTPTYDAENRIATDAGVTYSYDADGERMEKSSGMMYWPGPSGILAETDLSGTINEEYIYFNGARIARVDRSSGTVHYYFSNHLGSHTLVTSAAGSCEQDIEYYPYGGVFTDHCPNVAQHYKFIGKEHDSESGLDDFGARCNASSLGRFMSPDPIGGHQEDPQTLNRYAYVRNNPLNLTDPTGLDFYLQCAIRDHSECTEVQTDPRNSKSKQWVQADSDGNAKIITSDSIRNGQNSATVDQNGVQINGSNQGIYFDNAASHSTDANGNDVNHNSIDLAGSGGLNSFNFHIDGNCGGTCLSSGDWSRPGSSADARQTLNAKGAFQIVGEDVAAGFGLGAHPYSGQFRFNGGRYSCILSSCPNTPHLSVPYDPAGAYPKYNVPAAGEFHVDAHSGYFTHAYDLLTTH